MSYLLCCLFKVLLAFVTHSQLSTMSRQRADNGNIFSCCSLNLTEKKKDEKYERSLSNRAMIRNCVTLKREQTLTPARYRVSTTSCMGQCSH